MKILQVVPYFPPAHAFGGPGRVVYQFSRELVKRENEVVVYTTDAKDFGSRLRINSDKVVDGIRVHYFRNLALMPVKMFKLFITPQLVSHARREVKKFDVIHLHEYRTFQNIVIAHYAKKHGVPYVLQAHGSLPRMMAKQRLKWIYDVFFGYRMLRDAYKMLALTEMEALQYKDVGVPSEKIEIIPNGIDLSEFEDLPEPGVFRRKYGIEEERMILYLARMHSIKGIDLLLEAFANVLEELDNVKLVVAGPDEGYLPAFKELMAKLRIAEEVLYTGPLYSREKLEAYRDADVYVLPSKYETFPMSVLEAVACGTPVILTENCGVKEYFRDKVGLVVKPNSENLSEALLEILLDKRKQSIFRRNTKTVIGSFNISKTTSDLEEVYEQMVDSSGLSSHKYV